MFENKIVKKLHIVDFKTAPQLDTEISRRCKKSIETFCKDWELRYWNEEDFCDIVGIKQWVFPSYNTLIELKAWAVMSDIIRIYALYTEGGTYIDWDVEFIRNIPEDFFQHGLVLGFEPYTLNGRGTQQVGAQLCMSRKEHPLWLELYQRLTQSIWTEDFNILPGFLTTVLTDTYCLPVRRNKNSYYYLKDEICICPPELFYPFIASRETNPNSLSSYVMDSQISKYTIALHWEFSQNINKNSGWTNYLDTLKHTAE